LRHNTGWLSALTLAGVALFVSAAHAGNSESGIAAPADVARLKLGLWEGTTRSEHPAQPPVDMSSVDMSGLSAEQRARIEAVLERQRAQAKAAGGAPQVSTRTKQFCVRAGDLAADKHGMFGDRSENDSHCQLKEVSRTPGKVTTRAECADTDVHVVTEMSYEVKSPTEMLAQTSTDGTVKGRSMKSTSQFSARWLSADCGSVPSKSDGE
jgi:hypothetical protein